MILLLGHCDDALIREVSLRLCVGGPSMVCLGEPELFSGTPFAFEQRRSGSSSYIRVGKTTIRLDEVSGMLLRLPRLRWPSADFDLQDQTFVYHECSAAWFALLASLGCPVINRFDLAWWLSDVTIRMRWLMSSGNGSECPRESNRHPTRFPRAFCRRSRERAALQYM